MEFCLDRSYLSAKVKFIVTDIWNNRKSDFTENVSMLPYEEFSLLFDEKSLSIFATNHLATEDDFQEAVGELCPLFFLSASIKYSSSDIKRVVDWIKLDKHNVEEWFHLSQDIKFPEMNLNFMHMTSVFERALGNVYLLKGKQCPFLIRDLVQSEELKEVFGEIKLKLLQVLFGGPLSLNLRNLFWHGFVSDNEIPEIFYHFLLFLFVHLSTHIALNNLQEQIRAREFVTKTYHMNLIAQHFGDLEIAPHIAKISKLFQASPFISPAMMSLFVFSLKLFAEKRFGDCVLTLLPRIEHLLRCRYAACNNCPDRTMTAEATQFYTTIDDVMEETLACGSANRLREEVGCQTMIIVMDLFTLHHGLRLRDHLSHGEINPNDVDENIASVIMSLAVILSYDHDLFTKESSSPALTNHDHRLMENPDHEQPSRPFIGSLLYRIQSYESLFHQLSFTKRDIALSWQSCDQLDQSSAPREHVDQSYSSGDVFPESSKFHLLRDKLTSLTSRYLQSSSHCSPDEVPRHSKPWTISLVLEKKLSTLYRSNPKDRIARQIASAVEKMTTNMREHLHHGLQQYEDKLMRSRQRRNFHRFLTCLPVLTSGARLISAFLLFLIHNLPALDNTGSKKLKRILKISENLAIHTSFDVNKWDECIKYITDLSDNIPD